MEPGRQLPDIAACLATLDILREAFPQWQVQSEDGRHWARRDGIEKQSGPESLIRHYLAASSLLSLAERLALQEFLDGLEPDELAAVYAAGRVTPGACQGPAGPPPALRDSWPGQAA